MLSRLFDLDGCTLDMRAPDASHFEWFYEFYDCPPSDEPLRPMATIELVSDPARIERARAEASRAELGPGFTFDSRDGQIPRWHTEETELAFDPELGVLFVVCGRRIRVTGGAELGSARVAWMRVARELHERWLARRGFVLVHAAAVALPRCDHVVLLAGARKSGKSTLLTYLIAHGGAAYVTNDRAAVHPDGRVIAVPTVVSIRPGTLEHLPKLPPLPREHRLGYAHRRSLPELESVQDEPLSVRANPFSGSPAQFRAWLSARNVCSGRVIAALFPRVGKADAPELAPMRRANPLDAVRIEADDKGLLAGLVAPASARPRLELPAFVCRLGAYPVEVAGGLLEQLAQIGSHG